MSYHGQHHSECALTFGREDRVGTLQSHRSEDRGEHTHSLTGREDRVGTWHPQVSVLWASLWHQCCPCGMQEAGHSDSTPPCVKDGGCRSWLSVWDNDRDSQSGATRC